MFDAILAFCMPIGFMLVAWSGMPPARTRTVVLTSLVTVSLAVVAYLSCGFALQFGGLGLYYLQPGYASLRSVYSPLSDAKGWSLWGASGFWLDGGAPTPETARLLLHYLPLACTAALIPTMALAGRVRLSISAILAGLVAGILYPIADHWITGGGWLANLGAHLQLGHGAVDWSGAGPVYMLGSLIALSGLLLGKSTETRSPSFELPQAHFPWLALSGAALFSLGWIIWTSKHPLYMLNPALDLSLAVANGAVAALAAVITWQAFCIFASARLNVLLAARSWISGWIMISAAAPFIPTGAALLLGLLAGLLGPLSLWLVEHVLRRNDCTAVGLGLLTGVVGILAPGIWADGNWGAGWNEIGVNQYLGVSGQGVTGLLAAPGLLADPGQFTAQWVALGSIAVGSCIAAAGLAALLRKSS